MASPFQRQSQVRKIVYGLLIVALFTVTLFHRRYVLEAQADTLDLREQKLGDAELTGAVVRLTLTGSRGFALWALWDAAIDAQKKQQWNELELIVGAITKLQPHYTAPWVFQAWNLAYNVSHECDSPRDKYFYITRGIELLAEGQRQNRDNPDLRFDIGRFYQDKLGQADENVTFRTLFQLSCIRPRDRDAKVLRPDGKVDLKRFEEFCHRHPFLVRRMREGLGLQSPDDVIDFLAAHSDIPCYFPTRPFERPFPVLPRRSEARSHLEYAAEDTSFPDEFDNFTAARLWYTYAQEPLPPPAPMTAPASVPFDRNLYRLPKNMTAILFRQYPARSQTYRADRLQREGWFDQGWEVDDWRTGNKRWFPDRKVVIGGNRNWAGESWRLASELWEEHGERNKLWLDPEALQAMTLLAKPYRDAYGVSPTDLDRKLRPEDFPPEMREAFDAHRQLYWYQEQRRLTNFTHFQAQAKAEGTKKGIQARKLFHQARRAHAAAEDGEARVLYEKGIELWKQLLDEMDDFRADKQNQEDTYKLQWEYLRLLAALEGPAGRFRHVQPLLAADLAGGSGATFYLPLLQLLDMDFQGSTVIGPFSGLAKDGKPYVSAEAVRLARLRFGFLEKPTPKPQP